jgi:hypothetical protein
MLDIHPTPVSPYDAAHRHITALCKERGVELVFYYRNSPWQAVLTFKRGEMYWSSPSTIQPVDGEDRALRHDRLMHQIARDLDVHHATQKP